MILDEARDPKEKGPRGGARFRCAVCGEPHGSNDLAVDHIEPVVPIGTPAKEMSWDEVVGRMFNSPKKNLQAVCKICHDIKSKEENNKRRNIKKGEQPNGIK